MAGGIDINRTTARLSAALARYEPNVQDNVFKALPLTEHLKENKKLVDGGLEIAVHFEYGKQPGLADSGGMGTFTYYSELDLTPSDNVKTGTAPFQGLYEPVVYSWKEARETASPNRFDLVKQKVRNAEMSFADDFNQVCWGTSGGAAALIPTSIPQIITGANLASSYGATVYGLSKTSNTWMYSQEISAVGEFADFGIQRLRTLFNRCAANSPNKQDHPTLWMTDQDVFEAYEDLLPPQYRTDSLEKGDIGFQQLFFKGVPMRFDLDCPTDPDGNHQVFALNKNYLKLVMDKEAAFKTFPFVWMYPKYLYWAAQILFSGNIICTNFRTQGVAYGITVTL